MKQLKRFSKASVFVATVFVGAFFVTDVHGQMKQPKIETLSGTLIDLTCAAKGQAMMDSWNNTAQDHMMPGGKVQKNCATMH